ncbi:hypothetical protein BPOR_1297g00020 [Botrytis porri]|uniref:Chitin synthase export chaperone n=1 Tax=Botrytis porri TaxID=87229 RepID=A0A4Z1K4X5_9HELO|nr:hypothetical protein BPOR_1297g00020 [Botrytis porri]
MVDTIRSRDVQSDCSKDVDTNQSFRGYSIHVVPQSFGSTIGSPTALATGEFATTLTTLSSALVGFRRICMVISAQWELIRGNSYGYTVLSAFGLFYARFGALDIPFLVITAAYGDDTVQYNDALGFLVLLWSIFNLLFLIGSLPINLVYIVIFFFVQLAFTLVSASYFCAADGNIATADVLKKTAGAFAFIAGMFGNYTVEHLMCQEALFSIFQWAIVVDSSEGS